LARALAAGYPLEAVRGDPELTGLRSHPGFATMLAQPAAK
jgi:hypothetical protein